MVAEVMDTVVDVGIVVGIVVGIDAGMDDVESQAPAGELDLGYQVTIDAFSGPMDLLLYLVRRAQVDIADIPIATIADQFVETLTTWEHLDLDTAGDFIVMAATLLEIKSKMVAPPRDESVDDGDSDDELDLDPRAGLIQQLLAYRRFKEATAVLDYLELAAGERVGRFLKEDIPEDPDEADGIHLDNADPYALFNVYEIIQAKIIHAGPRTVIYDDTPMESRMASVTNQVQAVGKLSLRELLAPLPHRVHRAGMLIAVLECTRQRMVRVDQLEQFGEVTVLFRPEDDRAIATDMPVGIDGDEPKKRRRKPPLLTWHAAVKLDNADSLPTDAGAPPDGADVTEVESDNDEEIIVESDEQRFLREIEESCRLEEVLDRGKDLDASFLAFQEASAAAALAEAEAAERAKIEAAERKAQQALARAEAEAWALANPELAAAKASEDAQACALAEAQASELDGDILMEVAPTTPAKKRSKATKPPRASVTPAKVVAADDDGGPKFTFVAPEVGDVVDDFFEADDDSAEAPADASGL